MASPSGTSSSLQENLRKRKRMLSNRESARRSRLRKQKHLDDLTAQVANLTAENNHIITNINLVTHLHLNVESENSILMAQIFELNHRLQALKDIITPGDYDEILINGVDHDLLNHWGLVHVNHSIMASTAAFMY